MGFVYNEPYWVLAGTSYANTQGRGWISKASCWIQEASLDRSLLHCSPPAATSKRRRQEWTGDPRTVPVSPVPGERSPAGADYEGRVPGMWGEEAFWILVRAVGPLIYPWVRFNCMSKKKPKTSNCKTIKKKKSCWENAFIKGKTSLFRTLRK